jgi:hypothetical protein
MRPFALSRDVVDFVSRTSETSRAAGQPGSRRQAGCDARWPAPVVMVSSEATRQAIWSTDE